MNCMPRLTRALRVFLALIAGPLAALAQSATPAPVPTRPDPNAIAVPRLAGRLHAADIGLVINTADPYSVAVGAHYIEARKLTPRQVLRLELPRQPVISPEQFEALRTAIASHFGAGTQALALAWVEPYAVACNSITGALALGFDAGLCQSPCAASRPSPYFNSASLRPFRDLGLRPSMLLAARDVEQARTLIDRGVAADNTLGLRGAPPVSALFIETTDKARNARAPLFPPAGPVATAGLGGVTVERQFAAALRPPPRVVLVQTGSVRLDGLGELDWVPGGLGDHLTSFGGMLADSQGQSNALEWIAGGATASYGTVSEPCSHPQKFPHPQVVLLNYLQGSTAIEAYWKSVAWPQQGLFVGEPLAAPFARR